MQDGYVSTNILDIRAEPEHGAERVNQALLGDPVRWATVRGGFAYVRQEDGYRGWADLRFLGLMDGSQAAAYRRRPLMVVTQKEAAIRDTSGRAESPHILYFGTRIRGGRLAERRVRFSLPGGPVWQVKATRTRPIISSSPAGATGARLVAEARRLLGVPYLWGGVTSTGLDCSGLVQTVCRNFGLCLPRDTKDQIKAGEKVERSRIRSGDLLFFRRHVGFAIGSDRLIHASRGGGGVRIESLKKGLPGYRADLDQDFIEARRIV